MLQLLHSVVMILVDFSGDLMAALLLARLDQTPDDLKRAVELALAGLQHIVSKTYEASNSQTSGDTKTSEVRLLILKSCKVRSLDTNEDLPL